ncbi:MAG: 5-histidylcysteine sulfoxide synthase [Pseudohongiellaceae bacterium]
MTAAQRQKMAGGEPESGSPQPEPVWKAGVASSLPLLDLRGGREAMLEYFRNTWALTERLFSALVSEEAYYVRPWHKTRHPLIFYYVHPVSFYVNKMIVAGLIEEPVNPEFEALFEIGVDEMTWDDLHEGKQDVWPSLAEVREYRDRVHELVCEVIRTHPALDSEITMDSPGWSLAMCFEHERIHLETSSVLMRELPPEHLATPQQWPQLPMQEQREEKAADPVPGVDYPSDNPMLEVPEQTVVLGKPRDWPTFGWDNEYGQDSRKVSSFRASRLLVCNGEFYEFVSSGAYLDDRYWSEQGSAWRRFRNTRWPAFWVQHGPAGSHRYRLRTTFGVIPMQWDWPAVVNYYEAKAYCAWRSERDGVDTPYRLLQEKEHLALRDPVLSDISDWLPGDDALLRRDPVMEANTPAARTINHNLHFGSEGPVDLFLANSRGFHDVLGNVWQWCEDPFHPLPGFEAHPYYVDFSTPCFDDEHQMILGGSFISTGDEASAWARFHFRPHFYQHAGFRLARGGDPVPSGNKYEDDATLNQYLLFHWGSPEDQRDGAITGNAGHPDTGPFMVTMADLVRRFATGRAAALDVGCAVGRASFELAREFGQVIGVDTSARFIGAADALKEQGSLQYQRLESGRFSTAMEARVDPLIERGRLSFRQADAQRLNADPGIRETRFDAVLLANLLCRLPDPEACLAQFTGSDSLLNEGGVLVIASPNTWMEQYTSPEKFLDAPGSERALDKLASLLPGFELLHWQDQPFMIREHRRKYEYVVSQVSVWRRTD